MNENMSRIRCTFSSQYKSDYVTVIYSDRVVVYDGCNLILEQYINDTYITGAIYIDNVLYFTKDKSNSIYIYDINNQIVEVQISDYEDVKLLKYINNTEQWFVLEINNEKLVVYDLKNREELFLLPIQQQFVDLAIGENGYGVMIGCDEKDVSRYRDDDDTEYTILCSFKYTSLNNQLDILDNLKLIVSYDDWDDKYMSISISKENMKIPLYTGTSTIEKSISAYGNFIVYYSDDSKRFVISKYQNAEIHRIFILPKEFTENAKYYFNEETNVFTIFDNDCIEQYIIQQSNEVVDRLNKLHDCKNKNLLENILYKTIFSCKCTNVKDVKYEHEYERVKFVENESEEMYNSKYTYKIVDIDQDIMDRIKEKLQEGEKIIQEIKENKFKPTNISWIESFSSFIYAIDPEGNDYSDSLASHWHKAKWCGGNYPKTDDEHNIVLSQCLGVINALMNGKAKIVEKKNFTSSNSIFHKRNLPLQENFVFVLMPFTENWSEYIWREEIKPIVESIEEYNLICKRADDLYGYDIMQDIYESILSASIIIADITNRNANVFYELGIAHTLGKEVILLTQSSDDIPFDVNRFRNCIYSNDGIGYKKLRQYIPEAIRDIFNKRSTEIKP